MTPSERTQAKKLEEISRQAIFHMRVKNAQTPAITFLSDKEMRVLEKTYMKKEKEVVDVLSFPEPEGFPHPDTKERVLGQIFLNRNLKRGNKDHLSFLVIHGTLHLLGYRHEAKKDILEMKKAEEKLCRLIISQDWTSEPRR